MGALICVPLGSKPAQRLRQRHIYSGAASRRVSGVTETSQGCWPARRGSCYPPRAEGTEGGNRVSRACETWGGEDAASWHLPLAQPSGGVLSGGVQGRAERRIPEKEQSPGYDVIRGQRNSLAAAFIQQAFIGCWHEAWHHAKD